MAKLVRKTQPGNDTQEDFRYKTLRIAELAAEHKAVGIKAYDVRGLTLVADSFVMCSARSGPQFKAVMRAVTKGMREVGIKPAGVEGEISGGWDVVDYGDVVFHLFREEAREFYDLDGLWGDAPEIELNLEP